MSVVAEKEKRYVNILLDDEMVRAIDDFWHEHKFPSRTEAIRKLLEQALKLATTPTQHAQT